MWYSKTMRSASKSPVHLMVLAAIMLALMVSPFLFLTNPQNYQLGTNDIVLPSPHAVATAAHGATTIVTCFFDLNKMGQKTKHDPEFYLHSGAKGTLAIASPMIIFTDSPVQVAAARGRSELTHIVSLSISDFAVARDHLQKITQLVERDMEAKAFKYSGLLFTVYHAKPEMMQRAVELNPFNTEKFLYMDVGAVRDWGGIEAKNYIDAKFPSAARESFIGRDNKIQLQAVAGYNGPCEQHVRWVDGEHPNKVSMPQSKVDDVLKVKATPVDWWIAGSIFGGSKQALQEYSKLYYHALKRYLDADLPKYSLIDQYLMGALACTSDLIEVVKPPLKCCVDRVNRKWGYMLLFLRNDTVPQMPYSAQELQSRPKPEGCKYC